MRRLLSTRFGFFAFAALVCWALLLVIEPDHRWVALAVGCLYAVLALLFLLEEAGRTTPPKRRRTEPEPVPDSPFAPPPRR
jgi:apolipoprotein N-acyltransferase